MSRPLITQIDSLKEFQELATVQNPGAFVVKFGAEWCGPCKKIEALVDQYFDMMPVNISTIEVDIDQGFDIYGFLRSKKVVNGIPVMLAYYKQNTHYVPDDIVIGTDTNQIKQFFSRCIVQSKQ
jgi:thiol-disulfide isomerase/thioredoxin